MGHYSALSVIWNGLTGNKSWERAWRDPEPRVKYDVIIIGGGGHGLATAYYLAKNHGIRRVAVLEKGLDRRRQLGPEHDDCPVELLPAGQQRVLRAFAETVGEPLPRSELQRDVQHSARM